MWALAARAALVCGVLLLSATAALQSQAPPAGAPSANDQAFYAVAYVETGAESAANALRALRAYKEAAVRQDGCVAVELFDQIGRPGHWVVIETWRDAKTFDARDQAASQHLTEALRTIRISGWDQRPYKTISVAAGRGSAGTSAVSVIAHVDVAPNPAVAPMLARLAAASREEPGNVRFDVLQHTMRANHFTVIETWRDQKALDAHATAAHTRQYRDEVLPLAGSPLDERTFTSVR